LNYPKKGREKEQALTLKIFPKLIKQEVASIQFETFGFE
jgi:hypothetical protein